MKEYFRLTASVDRNAAGKLIRKEFYGCSKKVAKQKKITLNSYRKNLKLDLHILIVILYLMSPSYKSLFIVA